MREKITEKIEFYLSDKISKQELYQWTVDILHVILKNVNKLEYLRMLPIVKELAEIEDMDERECNCLVQRIHKVLSGDQKACYTFAIRIPPEFVRDNLLQIGNILEKCLTHKQLAQDEFQKLKKASEKSSDSIKTINDLLELQIAGLLNLGYDLEENDIGMNFNLKSTVYISKDFTGFLEDEFLGRIISLVECYNGEKCFYVQVWFHIDTEDISIHL